MVPMCRTPLGPRDKWKKPGKQNFTFFIFTLQPLGCLLGGRAQFEGLNALARALFSRFETANPADFTTDAAAEAAIDTVSRAGRSATEHRFVDNEHGHHNRIR